MFFRKKKVQTYDKENLKPVVRCSICTSERVAGFMNIHTGEFKEIMVLRNPKDTARFMEMYDLDVVENIY